MFPTKNSQSEILKPCICFALAFYVLSVASSRSQDVFAVTSADFNFAAQSNVWSVVQADNGPFGFGATVAGGGHANTFISWGASSWNISISYDSGKLSCVASNNAGGGLTPIILPLATDGTIGELVIGASTLNAGGSPSPSVYISDVHLNGSAVPDASMSLSGAGLEQYVGIQVNGNSFSSLQYNLSLGPVGGASDWLRIYSIAAVPEPEAMALAAIGGAVLLRLRSKRNT